MSQKLRYNHEAGKVPSLLDANHPEMPDGSNQCKRRSVDERCQEQEEIRG
nr:hypothetical protein [Synechococcus sp. CS-1329]